MQDLTVSLRMLLGEDVDLGAWGHEVIAKVATPGGEAVSIDETALGGRLRYLSVPGGACGVLLVENECSYPTEAKLQVRGCTPREAELLVLVMRGLSDSEIAAQLSLSTRTVQNRLHRMYRRIGVRNRAAAVTWAFGGIRP